MWIVTDYGEEEIQVKSRIDWKSPFLYFSEVLQCQHCWLIKQFPCHPILWQLQNYLFSYSLKLLIEDKGSIFLLVCLSLPRSPEGTLLNLANDERTQIVQVTSFQMRGRDAKGCVFLPSLFSGDIVLSFPPGFLLYLVFLYYSYYSVGVESE